MSSAGKTGRSLGERLAALSRPDRLRAAHRTVRRLAFAVLFLGLAYVVVRRTLLLPGPEVHEFSGPTMGTTYTVKVAALPLPRPELRRIADTITERLRHVTDLMSTYEPDSELSRFNRHASTEPFPLSPETCEVFRVAQDVSQRSGGAFDVTVKPLVDAWGFGPPGRPATPPTPEELAALRERVGYRLLTLDLWANTLAKSNPATTCDLSAVAKGYAVDAIATALLELDYKDFLVEVGGEIRAHGHRQDGRPWRVAVERPDAGGRATDQVVDIEDLAMATSGDYRNYYEQEGHRISHLIDPRTERPIDHLLASVSVAHERCDYADAWATALMVLGPEEGRATAEREGLAAYFLVREGDGFRALATPAFQALID